MVKENFHHGEDLVNLTITSYAIIAYTHVIIADGINII